MEIRFQPPTLQHLPACQALALASDVEPTVCVSDWTEEGHWEESSLRNRKRREVGRSEKKKKKHTVKHSNVACTHLS